MAEGIVAEVEYRTLAEFPGYRFGSDGSVWSLKRPGKAPDSGEWRRLMGTIRRKGYRQILMRANGRSYTRFVHTLILLAFVGPKPAGMECAHENGIHDDNRRSNLSWKTPKQNWSDKRRHGTACEGERSHLAKLTSVDVLAIVAANRRGESSTSLGRAYGITTAGISNITRGKTWRSLTGLGAVK